MKHKFIASNPPYGRSPDSDNTAASMFFRCCVPNCCAGLKKDNNILRPLQNNGENQAFIFRFPSDPVMREKWIKAIPKLNFEPTDSHRVCNYHFSSSDFITYSEGLNISRRKKMIETPRKRPKLKPTAVPHIFIDCQKILNVPPKPRIIHFATTCDRSGKENYRIERFNLKPVEELNEEEVSEILTNPFNPCDFADAFISI